MQCAIRVAVLMSAMLLVTPNFAQAQPSDLPHGAAEQPLRRERLIQTQGTSNIAYNTFDTIPIDKTIVIQLKASPSVSADELKHMVDNDVKKKYNIALEKLAVDSIPFARRMNAYLQGSGVDRHSGFAIQPIGPGSSEIPRELEPGKVTEWTWEVTPIRSGIHRLYLSMDVIIDVDGKDARMPVPDIVLTVDVNESLVHLVTSFIINNYQFILPVIIIPLVGWIIRLVRQSRQ